MPIEIDKPVFVKYRKDDQSEYEDVGYWILPRLSWQDFRAYADMAGNYAASQTMEELDHVAEFLVAKGLVRFEGVLKDGILLSKDRWQEAPDDLLLQLIRELQSRNTLTSVSHPNSSTPSAQASAGDGRALRQSPTISDEKSNTPSPSPTPSDSPVS